MKNKPCVVIAVANEKGGVGKTTTASNLSQAISLKSAEAGRVLGIDFDPQGNFTQASGIELENIKTSISELIRDKNLPESAAIYKGPSFDLIPATPELASVARELVGRTNGELRLAHRVNALRAHYSYIFIDTPPSYGPLMNSVLNAADGLIIPVDCNAFALHGIRSLLSEIEEIRSGTNSKLQVIGFLLTFADNTKITQEITAHLQAKFGDLVFKTVIRRSVKLREAPALARTVFHHAPESSSAAEYLALAGEVLSRVEVEQGGLNVYPIAASSSSRSLTGGES